MDLILVTHGATHLPPDLCVGQAAVPLCDEGFTAIQSLAATWQGPAPRFLFSSDLRQAQQSAQVFAAQFATEPLLDARLRDIDMGQWQGARWADIARDQPRQLRRWQRDPLNHGAPDGENLGDLLHRCGSWLAALLESTRRHDTVLSVVHGNIVRALLCHGLGLAPARQADIAADPARASMIRCRGERFEVCYLNASAFQIQQVPDDE